MRYALVASRYAPLTGGVEQFSASMARILVAQGHQVAIITSQLEALPAHEREQSGVEVFRLPARGLLSGRLPVPRRGAVFAQGLDAIATWAPERMVVNTRFYGLSIEGLKLAERLDIPALVLDHGSAHLTMGNPLADWVVEAYEHKVTRICQSFNPRFAGISQSSCRWLEHFGIKTATVIPNAIDAFALDAEASACQRDFRQELSLDPERPLVISVGRLVKEKGALELLEVATQAPDLEFALAGDGPLKEQLAKSKPKNVHLLGILDHGDLSGLYSQSDAFCLPSRSEGFCTAFLEAGAFGLPMVVTDVGGAREVLGDDFSLGVLLNATDPTSLAKAIRQALELPEGTRKALTQRVRTNYNWQMSAQRLQQAFA